MTLRESDIEKYLKTRVENVGGLYRRLKWQGRCGAPDDLVLLKGAHFVECKAPGEPLRPHQEREHARMRAQGVDVWVLDSYESVENFIAWASSIWP